MSAPRDFWKERDTRHLLSSGATASCLLHRAAPLPPRVWAKEKWILTRWSWALGSQDVRCCQKEV